MKNYSFLALFLFVATNLFAQQSVSSPDGLLKVDVFLSADGEPMYQASYDGIQAIAPSTLGLVGDFTDMSRGLSVINTKTDVVTDKYTLRNTKQKDIDYKANRLQITYANAKSYEMTLEMQVSDNNIAFRYSMPRKDARGGIRVMKEATAFAFPATASSFLCPQAEPMVGWERTKPSYEEEYVLDAPISHCSPKGTGFTFPCLFKSNDLWVLVGETGVDGYYCGSRLLDPKKKNDSYVYELGFPQPGENNGVGNAEPTFMFPGHTPWRTITIGKTLNPIVETTITWDVVKPYYEPSKEYEYGKGTWSWIVWQDESINYDDQVKFIDLASAMGYKYALVDNYWDTNIGKEGIEKLAKYARSKNVDLFLWYNSNGAWSDAPQGPRGKMDNIIARRQEMQWLKKTGVKGIKVDFFGGDKQQTIQQYEAILADANEYGIMVIFHGCTMPRGWERMYPNYVGSEAVLASENLYFNERDCKLEATRTCTHPFIRNTQGCMEFGGCFMNRKMSKDNKSRHGRYTTDVFELATEILFQNPIQNVALTPNNLEDAPEVCMNFLRSVPTTWEQTRLVDGYPGKNVTLARKSCGKWYIAAANAEEKPYVLTLDLNAFEGMDISSLKIIKGGNIPVEEPLKAKKGKVKLTINQNDAVVIY